MLIRRLTEQLNGDLSVRNEKGAHFKIVFKEEVKERF